MNICTKYGFDILIISGSYGGHRQHTTDDRRRTTPRVWQKLPTGELKTCCSPPLDIKWSVPYEHRQVLSTNAIQSNTLTQVNTVIKNMSTLRVNLTKLNKTFQLILVNKK